MRLARRRLPRGLALLASALSLLAVAGPAAAAPAPESRLSLVATTVGDAAYVAPAGICPGAGSARASASVQLGAMACLVNYARRVRGVRRLRPNVQLARAGSAKLSDNDRCDEFSHTACGLPLLSAFQRSGYVHAGVRYSVGENLGYGAGSDGVPVLILRAWLASPGHRATLFDPIWREFGVSRRPTASFIGLRAVTLWATEFGVRTSG